MRALTRVPLPPPIGGTDQNQIPPEIQPPFVWKSSNVVDRYGQLRTRPGFRPVMASQLDSRVMGGNLFVDAAGSAHNVAATLTALYQLTSAGGTNITGTPALSGNAANSAQFAQFNVTGVHRLIMVNNVDAPRVWDGVASTFSVLGGTPPIARDVTACANRLVLFNVVESGIRSTSRCRVSNFNDPATWPGQFVFDTSDTEDDGVAVRLLNRGTFLLYKDNSIWIATAQASIFPFAVDVFKEGQPGPVSPAAVVSALGDHWFLGNDYEIYHVSPNGVDPVSRNVRKILQSRVRFLTKTRIWGVYRKVDRTVWFFFPSSSDDCDQAVSVHVETGQIWFHNLGMFLSAGWPGDDSSSIAWTDLAPFTWTTLSGTYPTWSSIGGTFQPAQFVGGTDGHMYRFIYDVDDAGIPITMSWETPPRPLGGEDATTEFDSMESFFDQIPTGDMVECSVGVTETYGEDAGPTYTVIDYHDTEKNTRQLLTYPGIPPLVARYMNTRFRVTSSAPVRYNGSLLYVTREEIS